MLTLIVQGLWSRLSWLIGTILNAAGVAAVAGAAAGVAAAGGAADAI